MMRARKITWTAYARTQNACCRHMQSPAWRVVQGVAVARPSSSSSTRLAASVITFHHCRSTARRYSNGVLVRARGAHIACEPVLCRSHKLQRHPCVGTAWSSSSMSTTSTSTSNSGFASERDFHVVADATLEKVSEVVEQLEEKLDDYESNLSQGVLNIQLGRPGTWVLNKQAPNQQIWWSSPISGPLRFEYEPTSKQWRTTRDKRELFSLLVKEVKAVTGVELDYDE